MDLLDLLLLNLLAITCHNYASESRRLCNDSRESSHPQKLRQQPDLSQVLTRELHSDSTSRQQHVSTIACWLYHKATMAQEDDDAGGQLVRQCCWIQEARVEVCTPSAGRRKRLECIQGIVATYMRTLWSRADTLDFIEPMI